MAMAAGCGKSEIAKETAALTEITTEAMPGEIETRNEGYAVGMEN